jgi:MobA/VirD2-like, nuclease domain
VIRKVIRGDSIGRTIHYLFGPGRHNEHTHPHLIAAWDTAWLDNPALAASLTTVKGRAKLIAALDTPRVLHEVQVLGGHVYHVPLSIPAEDGLLGDARWRQVVEEAMDALGFGPDAEGRGGCRWVAVHHGLSAHSNDHVHVVVQLVRGGGRIANLYRDWPKWDAVCQAAEQRWNLTRTRSACAGERPLSRPEVERAKRTGQHPARRELAHRVRAAAAATSSEPGFLAELRGAGVLVEPRVSGGRVVGYRVALESDGPEPLWLSGSQLHRDLSLPRLRARWDPLDPRWDRYLTQSWLGELDVGSATVPGSGLGWRTAVRMLTTATEQVRQLEPADT